MSVRGITAEAVRIADEGGLGALSMARVAEGLRVTTMAIYRYVPGKGELIELMFDAVAGEMLDLEIDRSMEDRGGSDEEAQGYREKLAVLARRQFAACNLHPWMLEVPVGGLPLGPNNLAWLESALEALSGTGVDDGEAVGLAVLLSGYVRGTAQVSVGLSQTERRTGTSPDQWEPFYARLMEKVGADGCYPRLAGIVASGVFNEPDSAYGEDFEFGLERVLDGIEVFVGRRSVQDDGG